MKLGSEKTNSINEHNKIGKNIFKTQCVNKFIF